MAPRMDFSSMFLIEYGSSPSTINMGTSKLLDKFIICENNLPLIRDSTKSFEDFLSTPTLLESK
ncbi:MAG: hypothetical protein AMQ74_01948 [Candidatus Methanofastidiosum methylothiophilum]|uniref:Uncharacterized protein n=1 Tax=Candidatus Methanofastidiosum methylothiophilum TaxID=1705564 RepID=A0A150IHW7_9EURY|nr:MAG: hypothetical protein AMQ74_01948 [Candidatus Methanofastidiosum methylthiophilus]